MRSQGLNFTRELKEGEREKGRRREKGDRKIEREQMREARERPVAVAAAVAAARREETCEEVRACPCADTVALPRDGMRERQKRREDVREREGAGAEGSRLIES